MIWSAWAHLFGHLLLPRLLVISGYLAACSGLGGQKAACFATYGGGSARSTLEKLRTKLEEEGAQVIGSLGVDCSPKFRKPKPDEREERG